MVARNDNDRMTPPFDLKMLSVSTTASVSSYTSISCVRFPKQMSDAKGPFHVSSLQLARREKMTQVLKTPDPSIAKAVRSTLE